MCFARSCCRSRRRSARYVKAMEFHPGNARAVHHANIGIDRTKSSRRLDAADPEPGYVGGMVPDADYPPGYMLGWTPGQHPRPSPEGMAWRLEPDSDLVVQLHLQPTGKPETVQVSVGFFFTDDPPTRTPVGLRLGSETIAIARATRTMKSKDQLRASGRRRSARRPAARAQSRTAMEAAALLPDGTARPLITIRIGISDGRTSTATRSRSCCRAAPRFRCGSPTTTPPPIPATPYSRRSRWCGDRTRRMKWETSGSRSCRDTNEDYAILTADINAENTDGGSRRVYESDAVRSKESVAPRCRSGVEPAARAPCRSGSGISRIVAAESRFSADALQHRPRVFCAGQIPASGRRISKRHRSRSHSCGGPQQSRRHAPCVRENRRSGGGISAGHRIEA